MRLSLIYNYFNILCFICDKIRMLQKRFEGGNHFGSLYVSPVSSYPSLLKNSAVLGLTRVVSSDFHCGAVFHPRLDFTFCDLCSCYTSSPTCCTSEQPSVKFIQLLMCSDEAMQTPSHGCRYSEPGVPLLERRLHLFCFTTQPPQPPPVRSLPLFIPNELCKMSTKT